MESIDEDELIFKIIKELVQKESNEIIGSNLSDDELSSVNKCNEWGLLTYINTFSKLLFINNKRFQNIIGDIIYSNISI